MTQTAAPTTDPTTPTSTKSTAPARLVGVDAVRGIALLGMIAVHSLYESGVAGKATWSFAIFGGRAAATFAVLSGVGIAFMTGRRRVRLDAAARGTIAAMITRALVIGAVGMTLGYGDAALGTVILPYYAVLFLLAIPLVFLPTWAVAAIGVLVAGGAPVLTHVLLPHLPVPTQLNPTVGYLVHNPLGLLSELSITGEYPALPWTAYVCAGLVIGRLTLSELRVAIGLLGTGLMLAFGAAIASATLLNRYGLAHIWATQESSPLTIPETTEMLTLGGDGTTPTSTWWWLAVNAPHTSSPFDLVGTTGAATALLGALLLLGHIAAPPVLRRVIAVGMAPLAAAGSMTLTLYTAHIAFINSDYDTYSPTNGYLLEVSAALLVGLAWRATAGRGPLEALVSALTTRGRRWATDAAREPSRAAAESQCEPAAKPNRDPTPS